KLNLVPRVTRFYTSKPRSQRCTIYMMGGDEGSSAAAVAISVSVGARKVLLEDVLLVAVHKARVDLHPASLEKACPCASNKKGVEDKAFDISDISDVPADKDGALSETAARATMFARVASLMNGRSGVRKEVIVLLCDMLNKGVVPLLARGESGGKGDGPALAKALLGEGLCLFQGEVRPLLEAASACGLSPLSMLTPGEGKTIALGNFVGVGVAAMAAGAAANAIEIADGTLAMN
ncbi:unnamed protein product, partial [Sphacelaria rigidula]